MEYGPLTTVATTAEPVHVAVPLPAVADVGELVYPLPAVVTTRAVPPAMVFVPVSATVAAALVPPPLNAVSVQVWPMVPVAVMPLVYVPETRPACGSRPGDGEFGAGGFAAERHAGNVRNQRHLEPNRRFYRLIRQRECWVSSGAADAGGCGCGRACEYAAAATGGRLRILELKFGTIIDCACHRRRS